MLSKAQPNRNTMSSQQKLQSGLIWKWLYTCPDMRKVVVGFSSTDMKIIPLCLSGRVLALWLSEEQLKCPLSTNQKLHLFLNDKMYTMDKATCWWGSAPQKYVWQFASQFLWDIFWKIKNFKWDWSMNFSRECPTVLISGGGGFYEKKYIQFVKFYYKTKWYK